ncbi:hypothetical protein SAMN05421890_0003 [Ensifer adhaerens]|nr:hypothetical protein SAMN05421890_0003 [Ensifer adhaerens]
MKKSFVMACAALIAGCSFAVGALAGEVTARGYLLNLKLTAFDARHDPDGIWSDADLNGIRASGLVPKIYTARITTPSGEWLLSQLAGLCNMQGMCDTVLAKIKPGTLPTVYANPQVSEGGKAELSLNYKKLTTEEIDENGHPFKGSYNLAPLK